MKLQDIRVKQTTFLKKNFWNKDVVYDIQNIIEVKYDDKWYPMETVKEYKHLEVGGL